MRFPFPFRAFSNCCINCFENDFKGKIMLIFSKINESIVNKISGLINIISIHYYSGHNFISITFSLNLNMQ